MRHIGVDRGRVLVAAAQRPAREPYQLFLAATVIAHQRSAAVAAATEGRPAAARRDRSGCDQAEHSSLQTRTDALAASGCADDFQLRNLQHLGIVLNLLRLVEIDIRPLRDRLREAPTKSGERRA